MEYKTLLCLERDSLNYGKQKRIRFYRINNMGDYEACILRLNMAINMNNEELLVIGDSDLLLHPVQGEWTTKNVNILLICII